MQDLHTSFGDFGTNPLLDNIWFRLALILLIVTIAQMVSRAVIDRAVSNAVSRHKQVSRHEKHQREATLRSFLYRASSASIWLVGGIFMLAQFPLNLSALLTSAGLIGVVAGIGAQSLIKDCLAGMFIILENQLRVEDIVRITTPNGTVSGQVEEVSVRTTRLRDLDGNLHILTNGTIGVITNMSYHYAQVNLDINITYDTDIGLVEDLIKQAGAKTARDPRYKSDTIEPITLLRVDRLGDSTVTLKALGKVKPGTQWDIAGCFRRHLKDLFDEHKVKAPYQTVVVEEEQLIPTKPSK